jgi:hypothetical protein
MYFPMVQKKIFILINTSICRNIWFYSRWKTECLTSRGLIKRNLCQVLAKQLSSRFFYSPKTVTERNVKENRRQINYLLRYVISFQWHFRVCFIMITRDALSLEEVQWIKENFNLIFLWNICFLIANGKSNVKIIFFSCKSTSCIVYSGRLILTHSSITID